MIGFKSVFYRLKYFREVLIGSINKRRVLGQPKVFCVGRNKTGTTSLSVAFQSLNFVVGKQYRAEIIAQKVYEGASYSILDHYLHSAQVFQDIPFSDYRLVPYLDKLFPDSKYILTVRDSSEQWYRSLVRYHSQMFGAEAVKGYFDSNLEKYPGSGLKRNILATYGTDATDAYNKDKLISVYEYHNKFIEDYFSERPERLLVLNLAESGSYEKFCDFIGVEPSLDGFPWENRS